jgi:ubiquinone/menaquinone biosynthesis C-methylase UbiE
MATSPRFIDVESAVHQRYGAAANEREAALCCPVDYDARYFAAIPLEVLERDYGCGDPSRYVRAGETVLDLGSGGGKICFIASQIVGPKGRVIGVDMNDSMLDLARRAAPVVAENVGFANVEFRRGRIQDLQLDLDALDRYLRAHPVRCAADVADLEAATVGLRREAPLVPDASVDIVISNCVLNLVCPEEKGQLIREIYRVLAVGGRIAIADIVSDEEVPEALRADPELWSGCVSGAFHERELLRELEAAGFYGVAIDQWSRTPFQVVDGIEFRSATITARKGLEGPCREANQAVIYRGPWKQVEDDDGHVLRRGERAAVCAKTFEILTSEPYADHVVAIPPHTPIPEGERAPFDCSRTAPRHPRESKGGDYRVTTEAAEACCEPDSGC